MSAPPKKALLRDEIAYSDLPERENKQVLGGRRPSDLLQAEMTSNPVVNCQNFKPAIDEFLLNGPSSDLEALKNLATEISSMNSQVDPTRLSMEIDANMGRAPSTRSTDFGPISLSSFSSLVDFGDLDKSSSNVGSARRTLSWQKSIQDLMPSEKLPDKYHKEYKCYESNDKQRISSNDWTIDYTMSSQTFAPTNEAPTELTNNVVTHVQLNDLNNDDDVPVQNSIPRPGALSNDKRQMSVEIRTASIGIDPKGRLGSYELVKTQLNMLPTAAEQLMAASHQPGFAGLGTPNEESMRYFQNALQQQQTNQQDFPVSIDSRFDQFAGNNNNGHLPQRPELITQPEQSIGTQIRESGLNLVVPPRANVTMNTSTGVIDPQDIKDGDVLLERGGKGNHHKGSRYYRRLINERRNSYQGLPDSARAEKMAISLSVVMNVKETGARFIHKKKGQYVIMGDREARNKISQALREKKERVMLDD